MDRHSHSLDDVRLVPPPAPLGMAVPLDSSHSYTFGLPDASANTKTMVDHSYYPFLHCQPNPTFYGRRSTNCLSLDMLGDEQFMEYIFWTHQVLTSIPVLLLSVQCNLIHRLPACVFSVKMDVYASNSRHIILLLKAVDYFSTISCSKQFIFINVVYFVYIYIYYLHFFFYYISAFLNWKMPNQVCLL